MRAQRNIYQTTIANRIYIFNIICQYRVTFIHLWKYWLAIKTRNEKLYEVMNHIDASLSDYQIKKFSSEKFNDICQLSVTIFLICQGERITIFVTKIGVLLYCSIEITSLIWNKNKFVLSYLSNSPYWMYYQQWLHLQCFKVNKSILCWFRNYKR